MPVSCPKVVRRPMTSTASGTAATAAAKRVSNSGLARHQRQLRLLPQCRTNTPNIQDLRRRGHTYGVYLDQLARVVSAPHLSPLRYVIIDGYYSKQKFTRGVRALGLKQINTLRLDANLRYLYQGPHARRGPERVSHRRRHRRNRRPRPWPPSSSSSWSSSPPWWPESSSW